ncbi:hypothetical protein LSUE1_G003658 [Lachnellula suecica]|uniref:Uncharacterized protein n=1 Tax=Lachnellula suecica TaxID=602035 RepID=A0A8T9C7V6_9HELO|nr:hypothetical protein LSUE1_G003658 [Lachnellula suecica]
MAPGSQSPPIDTGSTETNATAAEAQAQPAPAANKNGPDHRFQLNQDLLFEREFGGDTYVSAHLQRLQHGCFTDKNIHKEDTPHVTFVAITFTFHPCFEAHRFKSAVISITAKSIAGPIRILKFAPHLAFGRMSQTSMKWNFKLGASVGLSQGPVKAAVEPSIGYEKDSVVGTLMKIQGSTRSTRANELEVLAIGKKLTSMPDTKVVWSLEENTQQKDGLPREFTFVFLLERLRPARALSTSSEVTIKPPGRQRAQSHLSTTSNDTSFDGVSEVEKVNSDIGEEDLSLPLPTKTKEKRNSIGSVDGSGRPTTYPRKSIEGLTHVVNPGSDTTDFDSWKSSSAPIVEEGTSTPRNEVVLGHTNSITSEDHPEGTSPWPPLNGDNDVPNDSDHTSMDGTSDVLRAMHIASKKKEIPTFNNGFDPMTKAFDTDCETVFTPITFSITVEPTIDDSPLSSASVTNWAIVGGECGQRFPTALSDAEDASGGEHPDVMVNGLYNFAKLPGSWEDMVELPGNSVTSVVSL